MEIMEQSIRSGLLLLKILSLNLGMAAIAATKNPCLACVHFHYSSGKYEILNPSFGAEIGHDVR